MGNPSLRYYACGETHHDLSRVFSDHPQETRQFPSGVFLFEHSDGERVLFDTGYAPSMRDIGLDGAIYNHLMPSNTSEQSTIDFQLKQDDIDPSTIGRVVLSHLHPDHIGGIQYFPHAQFIISQGIADTLQSSKLKQAVLRKLIPPWFDEAEKVIINDQPQFDLGNGFQGYDVFEDGSYVVTELPGHAKGHLGAFVLSNALLAGDAAWGQSLLHKTPSMKAVPRFINDDFDAYQETAAKLLALQQEGTAIYFSHDHYPERDLIA